MKTATRLRMIHIGMMGILLLSPAAHAASYSFSSLAVPFVGAADTNPTGINKSGTVVGWYQPAPSTADQSFVEENGTYSILNVPFQGAVGTIARGINNYGTIVGSYGDLQGEHGFVDNGGVFTPINVPFAGASNVSVTGINNKGVLVGVYQDSSGIYHSFVDNGGTFTSFDLPLALGGGTALAAGINDSGQIIGTYGSYQAFLATPAVPSIMIFTSISAPGSVWNWGVGINNDGAIVGNEAYLDASTGVPKISGFVEQGGTYTVINDPHAPVVTNISGINDNGVIVGTYSNSGTSYAFIAAPVPEPSVWLELIVGLGLVASALGNRGRKTR